MPVIKEKYKPLYTSEKRYFVLTGGRGSGKTFVVMDFIVRLLEEVGQGILYTRYTMTSVEKTIIPLFTSYIAMVSDLRKYKITKQGIINLETKAFVMFSGIKTSSGDQTGKLKSLPNITTWVIEEGEDYNDINSFTDIDDSIRSTGIQNRVIWIQNPTTKEHMIFDKFFKNNYTYEPVKEAGRYKSNATGKMEYFKYQKCNHPDVEHIHTTYLDNKENLNKGKVKQWESVKSSNPNKYQHKYIGAWLDRAEGVIFTNWTEGNFDTSLPYGYGQDYGFSIDPTTLIKMAIDTKRKKCYWSEQYYDEKSLGTDDIFEINKSRIDKPKDLIVGDSQEKRLISDLKKKGLNIIECEKGPGSVKAGILSMLDYEHVVTPESHNIKRELNNYVWNDKKAGIPIDDYNHAMDGGRYIFRKLSKGNKSWGGSRTA